MLCVRNQEQLNVGCGFRLLLRLLLFSQSEEFIYNHSLTHYMRQRDGAESTSSIFSFGFRVKPSNGRNCRIIYEPTKGTFDDETINKQNRFSISAGEGSVNLLCFSSVPNLPPTRKENFSFSKIQNRSLVSDTFPSLQHLSLQLSSNDDLTFGHQSAHPFWCSPKPNLFEDNLPRH